MQHTTPGLEAAAEMLNNLTEEEIRLAEEIERRQNEFNQVLEFYYENGREEGIEIGEQRGMTKGQLLLCFKLNLPMEEIQKHTGLSIEEIEAFRKELAAAQPKKSLSFSLRKALSLYLFSFYNRYICISIYFNDTCTCFFCFRFFC